MGGRGRRKGRGVGGTLSTSLFSAVLRLLPGQSWLPTEPAVSLTLPEQLLSLTWPLSPPRCTGGL